MQFANEVKGGKILFIFRRAARTHSAVGLGPFSSFFYGCRQTIPVKSLSRVNYSENTARLYYEPDVTINRRMRIEAASHSIAIENTKALADKYFFSICLFSPAMRRSFSSEMKLSPPPLSIERKEITIIKLRASERHTSEINFVTLPNST